MENRKKYALITGATSGIGYELAKLFANDQYNLIIVGRDQSELEAKAQEFTALGSSVATIKKDLFNREETLSIYQEVRNLGLEVDVLVNDAGQGVYGLFNETELERELSIIELNVSATVILTKYFLKDMMSRGSGKILNLASIASKTPGPWQAVYHGTKAFVLTFSEGLREELKDTGVTVTALLPGVTDTDFFNKADMNDSKAVEDPSDMADPAKVASDGYKALMEGKDKVISGFKNKVQMVMSNVLPDTMVAKNMNEMQKPQNEEKP